jgi:hypothetical protein
MNARTELALFAFGAVVLSTFDGFHTHSGTTRYANVVALQAAWWTPLVFGLTTGVGGPMYAFLYRVLGGVRPPPSWARLTPAFGIFGMLYAFTGFYHGPSSIKLAVLAAAAAALFFWLDRTRAGALCLVVTTLTGPFVEAAQIRAGMFEYLQHDFLGVPMWLPALYACSAPVIGQGARRWLAPSVAARDEREPG